MRLDWIARVTSGRPSRPLEAGEAGGVSTDTRTIRKGEAYFALTGRNYDGHGFVAAAFERGACAAVVERAVEAPGPLIVVRDARAALGALAAAYRDTLRGRVIGVTGSNGKTTTKEMLGHILSKDRLVARSSASFNNEVGLPLTLLAAPADAEFVILEIGTNHPGEIARLGRIARPDVAVITSVGASHLEGFGSIDGVADEKTSLLSFVRDGGLAVLHHDPRLLSRARCGRRITFGMGPEADVHPDSVGPGLRFTLRGVEFHLNLMGEWNILNAMAACAVAEFGGVSLADCAARLADFRPPKMRMERVEVAGITVINDAYNSNPESAGRAVGEFARLEWPGRKVAVIGDMGELGEGSEGYHRALGRQLAGSSVDAVVGVGPKCRALLDEIDGLKEKRGFDSVDALCAAWEDVIRPGDAVLLKGSRSVGLERLLARMKEVAAPC